MCGRNCTRRGTLTSASCYGPWLKADVDTVSSNVAFDAELKRRDPEWGLPRIEDLASAGRERGLELAEVRQMPANNMMLLLRRC